MKKETPEDFVAFARSKGKSDEHIIGVLCKKLNREMSYHEDTRNKLKNTKVCLDAAQRESGRLITTKVTHIIKNSWNAYCWYKFTRYVYHSGGIWVPAANQGRDLPWDANQRTIEGEITVNLLLGDKDMPPKYTGVASGTLGGKKIILSGDFLINHGDEFVMYKKGEK